MFKNIINIDVTLSFKVKSFLKAVKKRLQKRLMSKNETFFFRLLSVAIFITPMYADISIALLKSIDGNSKQTLLSKNTPVACEPFGIITLEEMMMNTSSKAECKNAVATFYKTHPHDELFAKEHLYIQQSYHYETIKEGCVLYANGGESYSEMLLRQGLALIDPAFENSEWNGRLKRAQKGAEIEKTGLHDTLIKEFCIKEEK